MTKKTPTTKDIITACGGPVAISRRVSKNIRRISSQAVSQWKAIPSQYCIELESMCEYTRYQMRADVFGKEAA